MQKALRPRGHNLGMRFGHWSAGLRQSLDVALLRTLCAASGRFSASQPDDGLYWTRVFSGPLRGAWLSMPRLERPSFALGTYEAHVARVVQAYVAPGSIAYDVGAHIGYLTLLLARLVGADGFVYAFEPNPNTRRALSLNIAANRVRNVSVHSAAVCDRSGTGALATFRSYSLVSHLSGPSTPADAELVTVPLIRLDDFVFRDGHPVPGFVKIDVEGAEAEVFEGAQRLIQEASPVIVAEVRVGTTRDRIMAITASHGYTALATVPKQDLTHGRPADVLFLPARCQR